MEYCNACTNSATCTSCDAPYSVGEDNQCKTCDQGTYYEDAQCLGMMIIMNSQ